MNYSMVQRLVLKDWYFQRKSIGLAFLGGLASLAIVTFGGKPGFTIGLILLVTTMIAVGSMMVMSTMLGERENQTIAFVMSLPISYLEYSVAKILVNLLIFIPFWLILSSGSLALILIAPPIHGLFAFTVIMAVEIVVGICLMVAVGLVTESKGWTIAAMMVGNVGLNIIGYFVAHIPGIGDAMWSGKVYWSSAATIVLATEIALIAAMLGTAVFIQSRKTNFI